VYVNSVSDGCVTNNDIICDGFFSEPYLRNVLLLQAQLAQLQHTNMCAKASSELRRLSCNTVLLTLTNEQTIGPTLCCREFFQLAAPADVTITPTRLQTKAFNTRLDIQLQTPKICAFYTVLFIYKLYSILCMFPIRHIITEQDQGVLSHAGLFNSTDRKHASCSQVI